MKKTIIGALAASLLACEAQAAGIDPSTAVGFEGLNGSLGTQTLFSGGVGITFGCGENGFVQGGCFLFDYNIPATGADEAFVPSDAIPDSLPVGISAADLGTVGLSDENDGNLNQTDEYFFSFDTAVNAFGLLTLDFRADGGGRSGDELTLQLFSGANGTGSLVGSDSFTIVNGLPDPNAVELFVALADGVSALSGVLTTFRGDRQEVFDVGTGIDLVTAQAAGGGITTAAVPLPGAALLFGTALVGGGFARRFRARKSLGLPGGN